jgi:cell division protein FtsB
MQREELLLRARTLAPMATNHLSRIRWDRLARWALLGVLVLIAYLYVGPTRSWIATYAEAREKREEVADLRERNDELRKRHRDLQKASTLEHEARRLGMVRAGERAYVVKGLPED